MKVVSNYPLTVIGRYDCTTVPVSYLDCDPIATQLPPTINWGTQFLVMSSENGTNVIMFRMFRTINSNLAFAGNVISYYVSLLHYCLIQCSQPSFIHSVTFTTLPEMPTKFFGIVVPADSYFKGTVLINDVLTTFDLTIIYNINETISRYGYTTTANGNYTII